MGRARARMYAGLCVRVCLGVGLSCARVCAGVVGSGGVVAGFVCERGASWCFGGARQTHIMEQFTRCGSNALDSAAMHCLLPSAMLH